MALTHDILEIVNKAPEGLDEPKRLALVKAAEKNCCPGEPV